MWYLADRQWIRRRRALFRFPAALRLQLPQRRSPEAVAMPGSSSTSRRSCAVLSGLAYRADHHVHLPCADLAQVTPPGCRATAPWRAGGSGWLPEIKQVTLGGSSHRREDYAQQIARLLWPAASTGKAGPLRRPLLSLPSAKNARLLVPSADNPGGRECGPALQPAAGAPGPAVDLAVLALGLRTGLLQRAIRSRAGWPGGGAEPEGITAPCARRGVSRVHGRRLRRNSPP